MKKYVVSATYTKWSISKMDISMNMDIYEADSENEARAAALEDFEEENKGRNLQLFHMLCMEIN